MMNVELMNKPENIYTDGGSTIMDINELPYFDEFQYDFMDEKSYKRYVADIERMVRNSYEYRSLIKYLKYIEGMDECSFQEGVTSRDNSKVRIEIHHAPLTLYDICVAVIKKRQFNKESMEPWNVAEEVLYLHYIGWVGLIPLSETIHEMVHNQYLFVRTDRVRGHWRSFVESYYNFINPETLDYIDASEQATKDYNNHMYKQMEILNHHDIYVNVAGSYLLPKKQETNNMLRDRIAEIKNGGKIMCTIVKH